MKIAKPTVRVRYALEEIDGGSLEGGLDEFLRKI